MATGDVYYLKWKFEDTNLGTVYTPGIHVRQDGVSYDFNNAAAILVDVWNDVIGATAIKSWYKTTTQLTAILGRRVSPLEPIEQQYTTGLPIAGTGTSDQLAPQDSVLFSFRTALIGRSYRGRLYFPAPTESAEEPAGALGSTVATDMIDAMNHLDDLGAIGQLTPQVVWSPLLSSAEDVTERRIDRRIRTQRRRAIENPIYIT